MVSAGRGPGRGWAGRGSGEEPEDAKSAARLPAKQAAAPDRFQGQAKMWSAKQGN